MKFPDICAGILGLGLCFFVFHATASFPEDQVVSVGPAFFPRILAMGLGIFSCILIITAFFSKDAPVENKLSLKDPGIIRALISVISTACYCLLLDYLGFIACSIVYLFLLMILLKDRKYVQMVLTSISVTGVVFLIFKVCLNITLPMGTLYGF